MELTKKDLKVIKKWVRAMRSVKFKQTICWLQDENGLCCLGVACMITIPEDKRVLTPIGHLDGGLPYDQCNVPLWLRRINDDLKEIIKHRFTCLNDELDYSFPRIADVIEATYLKDADLEALQLYTKAVAGGY